MYVLQVHMISQGLAHQVYIIGHTDYVCLTSTHDISGIDTSSVYNWSY